MIYHVELDIIIYMQSKELRNQIIRYVIYIIVVLGLTGFAFYLTIGNKASEVFSLIGKANIGWLLLILCVIILCVLLRSVAIYVLAKIHVKEYSFHRAIAIDQNGVLYRMVTPAGLGSHVMQTLVLRKQKVSYFNALSVLAMYSIIYQIALIFYNVMTLIVKHELISEIKYVDVAGVNFPLWVLVAIGFTFNLLVIGFILLISYSKVIYRFVDGPIGKLLNKLRIVKDLDVFHKNLKEAVEGYRSNLKHIFTHLPTFFISLAMFLLYITISYSVPYFAGLALGNSSMHANFWDSVLLSNFHQMTTCVIPIPGSSLVSEFFFYRLFYPESGPQFFMTEEVARASLLLWRSLMFIIPLFISCLYVIIYRPRRKNVNEDQKDQDIKE